MEIQNSLLLKPLSQLTVLNSSGENLKQIPNRSLQNHPERSRHGIWLGMTIFSTSLYTVKTLNLSFQIPLKNPEWKLGGIPLQVLISSIPGSFGRKYGVESLDCFLQILQKNPDVESSWKTQSGHFRSLHGLLKTAPGKDLK